MRSTRSPPRDVVAQARITLVSLVSAPVSATIGASITIAETFVPASASDGVSPSPRRPFTGTSGSATMLRKLPRSKKKGSSRGTAKTRIPPAA